MSIEIINVTKHERNDANRDEYVIMINGQMITSFLHRPGDGLAKCLKKASYAAKRWQAERGTTGGVLLVQDRGEA